MTRRLRFFLIVAVLLSVIAVACGSEPAAELHLAPVSQLPPALKDAPANVQEAYRFAIANKELLEQIPCFCGCVAAQHESNYNCYVAEDGGPGTILKYDYHALGWGICVDITRDVMKMQAEGKTVEEMRAVVIERYGSFGPSTDENRGSYLVPARESHPSLSSAAGSLCSSSTAACAQ